MILKNETRYILLLLALIIIVGFFFVAKSIDSSAMEEMGINSPLPLFTIIIGLLDGFNPCTLFILTMLLGLLMSVSHSRKKIYLIGYTFVFIVFVIYYFFMAAWLNIFNFIGFATPLRITIASLAIIAGLINIKELIFFRKGFTLMIQDRHKAPLLKKVQAMKDVIQNGSTAAMIGASALLAAFSSLVELPCTAGFPIIYTSVLVGKGLEANFGHYLYLIYYNLVYVTPLAVVIFLFGLTFKGKQISKEQMQIIKYIGGAIMILLGIVLIVNPGLITGVA